MLTFDSYYRDNVYFLTAGKHAKSDYKDIGVKESSIIPFWYYPKGVVEKNCTEEPDSITHLLWVGRLVSWKHPEYAINTCRRAKRGDNVDLTIVGNGMMEDTLRSVIRSEEVRKIMRKSDIFLFTSKKGKGWGKVL